MMDKLNIEYSTVDITVNEEALDLIVSKGFRAAPVVITDSESWSGFNPDKISGLVS
jgi:glutaredoxin-like protein NrdH